MTEKSTLTENRDSQKRSVGKQARIARARARRFAMQAVYQHLLTAEDYAEILHQVREREVDKDFDDFFLAEIIEGIAEYGQNFDIQLKPLVNRPIEQLGFVEHAILLVACYELNQKTTPPKVIINEAIILGKKFGAEDCHKFINGVLDKLYQTTFR